jgi:VWFA-related protein
VVVSDGGDNASNRTLKEAADMAAASNTLIYTIGIYSDHEKDRNPAVLKRLAEITGGDAYFPRNGEQLSRDCKRIATDIRSQYTLGYIPANQKKDGSYREIKVKVKAPGKSKVTVRTRSGYLAQ